MDHVPRSSFSNGAVHVDGARNIFLKYSRGFALFLSRMLSCLRDQVRAERALQGLVKTVTSLFAITFT